MDSKPGSKTEKTTLCILDTGSISQSNLCSPLYLCANQITEGRGNETPTNKLGANCTAACVITDGRVVAIEVGHNSANVYISAEALLV